jgi:Zn-finger protein
MNARIKILILVCLLIFLFIFLVVCAPKRPIVLDKVFSQPDVDYDLYERLAIVEFTPNPQVKKRKNITDIFEDEFNKQGYDIVSMDEFNSVLKEFGFSSEDLSDPDVLNRVSEKLNISAVIKGTTNKYEIKKKSDFIPISTGDVTFALVDKVYICDIALTVEMIAAQEGNKVWSCSMSCSKKKGKPEKLIRNMIRDCLNTTSKE